MSFCLDVRDELSLRPSSYWVAQRLESKGLQAWTGQITSSTKMGWCKFLMARTFLMLMMFTILMWDDFVYWFGHGGGDAGHTSVVGGNFLTSWTLLPQCLYLLTGVIVTGTMAPRGGGHFKIAHWRMLVANSLFATVVYPSTMLVCLIYWVVDFPNRKDHIDFFESENGERVVAFGHTMSLVASILDVCIVEQPLFIFDVHIVILYGMSYIVFAYIAHHAYGTEMMKYEGHDVEMEQDGHPNPIVMSYAALMVIVALPLCHIFFWLVARGRSRAMLKFCQDKEMRSHARRTKDPNLLETELGALRADAGRAPSDIEARNG